jgi:hypothetical protein
LGDQNSCFDVAGCDYSREICCFLRWVFGFGVGKLREEVDVEWERKVGLNYMDNFCCFNSVSQVRIYISPPFSITISMYNLLYFNVI